MLARRALIYALTARIARAVDEGEPLQVHPHRLIEENLWRAIRYGLSGDLLILPARPTDRVRPARQALEELVDWVLPVAEELGVASYLERARARTPPSARSPASPRARRSRRSTPSRSRERATWRVGAPSG